MPANAQQRQARYLVTRPSRVAAVLWNPTNRAERTYRFARFRGAALRVCCFAGPRLLLRLSLAGARRPTAFGLVRRSLRVAMAAPSASVRSLAQTTSSATIVYSATVEKPQSVP